VDDVTSAPPDLAAASAPCPESAAPEPADEGPAPPAWSAEQALRASGAAVYNLARRLVGRDGDAEAVTGAVLAELLREMSGPRPRRVPAIWLPEMTVRAIRARRRQPPRRPGRAAEAGPAADRKQAVEEAVARLPEGYRHVFVLADVECLSVAGVAQILGLSPARTKARLHRARLLIHDALTVRAAADGPAAAG
jgi:RNA polymerase sigma-70 factor (ECF subfamily)